MKAYALEITTGPSDDIRTKVEQVFTDKEVAESRKLDLERRASLIRHRIEMCQLCEFGNTEHEDQDNRYWALVAAKELCPYASMNMDTGEVTCAERAWIDYVPDYRISEIELIGLPESRCQVIKKNADMYDMYLDDKWYSSHSAVGTFIELDDNYIIDFKDESDGAF